MGLKGVNRENNDQTRVKGFPTTKLTPANIKTKYIRTSQWCFSATLVSERKVLDA